MMLLGVLPLNQRVHVPGRGLHVLTPEDLELWAERASGTLVHSEVSKTRTPAGHVDRVRIDKGQVMVYGDLDPRLPGGAEARWGVLKSGGVCDRLNARLAPRPDPLGHLSERERAVMKRHWGTWPVDDAGVIITSVSVAPVGLTPDARWVGA